MSLSCTIGENIDRHNNCCMLTSSNVSTAIVNICGLTGKKVVRGGTAVRVLICEPLLHKNLYMPAHMDVAHIPISYYTSENKLKILYFFDEIVRGSRQCDMSWKVWKTFVQNTIFQTGKHPINCGTFNIWCPWWALSLRPRALTTFLLKFSELTSSWRNPYERRSSRFLAKYA